MRRALRVVVSPEEVEVEGVEPSVEQVAEGALARYLVERLGGVEAAVREDARHAARARPPPEEVRRSREEQPRCCGDRQAQHRSVAARHEHDMPPHAKHRLVDALEAGRGVVLGHKQAGLLALRCHGRQEMGCEWDVRWDVSTIPSCGTWLRRTFGLPAVGEG